MSDQAQSGVVTKISRGQSQQQTAGHLVFVDPAADNASERAQELQLIQPLLNFQIHSLTESDVVGQITKVLEAAIPGTVRSISIVCGREISLQEQAQLHGANKQRSRGIKLDSRIADWQEALAPRSLVYLLGDQAAELAEHIRRQTTAEVRFDFESVSPVIFDEVMFIDHSLPNFEPVVRELLLNRDVEIVTLDSETDGLEQIAQHLANRQGLKTLHWICPSTEEELKLGNAVINDRLLAGKYSAAIYRIRRSLAQDCELRIYSSRFNRDFRGVETLKALSGELGAFVVVVKSDVDAGSSNSELFSKLKQASTRPTETAEWGQLLSPLKINEASAGSEIALEGQLEFDGETNELRIRYEFDRMQAIGWLCIGFFVGFLCQKMIATWGI